MNIFTTAQSAVRGALALSMALPTIAGALMVIGCATAGIPLTRVEISYGYLGGNGGKPFATSCGTAGAINAINGNTGNYIDRMNFYCIGVQPNGFLAGPGGGEGGAAGGPGGDQFASISCGSQEVAVGLSVRTGDYVNAIRLECYYPKTWNGATNTPPHPTAFAAGREVGGPVRTALCGPHFVMVGIVGKADVYVDAVTPVCLQFLPTP